MNVNAVLARGCAAWAVKRELQQTVPCRKSMLRSAAGCARASGRGTPARTQSLFLMGAQHNGALSVRQPRKFCGDAENTRHCNTPALGPAIERGRAYGPSARTAPHKTVCSACAHTKRKGRMEPWREGGGEGGARPLQQAPPAKRAARGQNQHQYAPLTQNSPPFAGPSPPTRGPRSQPSCYQHGSSPRVCTQQVVRKLMPAHARWAPRGQARPARKTAARGARPCAPPKKSSRRPRRMQAHPQARPP